MAERTSEAARFDVRRLGLDVLTNAFLHNHDFNFS